MSDDVLTPEIQINIKGVLVAPHFTLETDNLTTP
jgi:hypothetical protein